MDRSVIWKSWKRPVERNKLSAPRLSKFKDWADKEFGGVRAAFSVLDEDNSGDFNAREFIKMLRYYGFQGDCRALFLTLDCDHQNSVGLSDIAFLDMWESAESLTSSLQEVTDKQGPQRSTSTSSSKQKLFEANKKTSKIPKVSPRLEQLARCRHPKLPLLPVASKSTLASFTTSSAFSKSYLLKSTYGRFPRDTFATTDPGISKMAWRNLRMRFIKEEILCDSIRSNDSEDDLSCVKKTTIALRNRTMELFNIAANSDEFADP